MFDVTEKLIESMVDEDTSLLSLYYGSDMEEEKVQTFVAKNRREIR